MLCFYSCHCEKFDDEANHVYNVRIMSFNWIDVLVLFILAVGAIRGWRAGFIVMVGNIASLVVGVVVTAWIFSLLSSWHLLANWHIGHPIVTVIVFLLILAVVVKLLRLVVKLLNGIYRIISIIPGMGLLNGALGSVVGLAQGAVVLVLAVYLLLNVVVSSGLITSMTWVPLEEGSLTLPFIERAAYLLPSFGIWV